MAASSASTPVTTSATTTTTTTDAAHGDASSAAGASSDTATEPPLALAAAAALPAPPPPLPPPPLPLPPSSAPLPPPPTSQSASEEPSAAVCSVAVPAETHFASREELLSYVHEFTVSHGYAVVIQKSNVPRGQVWLRCDLGGSYRNTLNLSSDSRKRKCSSRLKNCPFQLYARRLPDARWLLKVQNASHNHDVATDTEQLVAHPVARRLTLEQKKLVDELTEMGARPALIVEKMKQKFPDKPIKVQDIYNTRNFIRRERGAGRDPFPESANQEDEDDDDDEGKDAPKSSVVVAVGAPSQVSQQRVNGDGNGVEVEEQTVTVHAPVLPSHLPPSSAESLQPAALTVPAPAPPTAQAPLLAAQTNQAPSDKKNASAAAYDARLRELLRDASDSFCTFQTRTQKQFLFQLELLLEKSKKGSNNSRASSSSSSSAAKKSPRLGRTARNQQQQKQQQTSAESIDSNSSSSSDGTERPLPPGAQPPAAPGNSIACAISALQ